MILRAGIKGHGAFALLAGGRCLRRAGLCLDYQLAVLNRLDHAFDRAVSGGDLKKVGKIGVADDLVGAKSVRTPGRSAAPSGTY